MQNSSILDLPIYGYRLVGEPDQIAALNKAMAAAMSEFKPVIKDKTVAFTGVHYDYATHDVVVEATKEALAKHGLSVRQPVTIASDDGGTLRGHIITVLAHAAGAYEVSMMEFVVKGNIKDLGGDITYLKRYARTALLSLGAEDAEDNPAIQLSNKPEPVRTPPKNNPLRKYTDDQRKTMAGLFSELGIEGRPAIMKKCDEVMGKPVTDFDEKDADSFIKVLRADVMAAVSDGEES